MSIGTRDDLKNEEEGMHHTVGSFESEGKSLVLKKCNRKLVPDPILILNTHRSRMCAASCEFFFQNFHGFHSSIPKHITSFDEKYAFRCLEMIRNYAIRSAEWDFSQKSDVFPGDLNDLTESRNRRSCKIVRLSAECPVAFGIEAAVNSSAEWTIGAVTQSPSLINILKSPLLRQFGLLDNDVNFGRVSLPNACGESVASPNVSDGKYSQKLQKEASDLDYRSVSTHDHKRIASISSTNSSSSDQSCSTPLPMFQGMLQCKWKDGLPCYVFTVDGTRDVYVANLSRVESLVDKFLDYVYNFHSRPNVTKECPNKLDLKSVGSMQVCSSVTVSSDNSEVVETRFILFSSDKCHLREMQTSKHTLKKNERLARKVRSVFKSRHSYKNSSGSKFHPSSAILEDTSLLPSEDIDGLDTCGSSLQNKCIQNFESAAIVVKDRIVSNHKVPEQGGWGMKFLRSSGNIPSETLMLSKSTENPPECTATINVIIPAGFHGGSRTRNGGPSSLIERWVSGGRCDCEGWDTGCPLTILTAKSSDPSPVADQSHACDSTDLFVQGTKQNVPIMKMVNVHDGLYYIHFQSTLSILQSFAIAAAILHSRSSVFRPKLYRS